MQNRKRSMKRSASRSASMRGGESTLPVGNVVGNPNSLSASSGAIVGGRRHRRHRRKTVSSWDKHYNYESDNDKSVSIIKSDQNNGNIVNGLKDFLQGKKVN